MIVTSGALGVFGTLTLMPKQLADATPSALSAQLQAGTHRQPPRSDSSPAPIPVPTSTTVPPVAPTPAAPSGVPTSTTVPPAPARTASPAAPPALAQPVATRGMLPPQNPSSNIPPQPNFLNSCSGSEYDDSSSCVAATLDAIDNARQAEGLPAMVLPGNWQSLTPQEQLFVATNLERTVRGLPALQGMATSLDEASQAGAAADVDPSPPPGFGFVQWGSNWAGAVGNPLEAIYFWMYDDGPGSSNIDCTQSDASGCWGHRDNVLINLSCDDCVMGVGYVSDAYQGTPSWTELLVEATQQVPLDFSWQQQ